MYAIYFLIFLAIFSLLLFCLTTMMGSSKNFKNHTASLILKLRQEYEDGIHSVNQIMSETKTGL